ncbi:sulfatase-modifying factor protein [Candidatus Symbiothrix dinenymphae]|nr:sulfatase-modifying factor protein [Candidatus Symbiothrix dinenymphae]
MKTRNFISSFCLLLAMGIASTVVTSCTEEAPALSLKLDNTSISATREADTYSIVVTSNGAWTATVGGAETATADSAWCTIEPTSGTNNGKITLDVAENTSIDSRSATITVISGALTWRVTVTQAAPPLTLDKASISATYNGGTDSIAITSNGAWTAIADSAWCTLSPTSGTNDDTITVNVAENTTTAGRSATITVISGSFATQIIVTQDAPPVTLDITDISAAYNGGTYPIAITSSAAWAATSDWAWCTLTPAYGTTDDIITVNVAENPTANSRSATITFTSGSLTRQVTVKQATFNRNFTETGGGLSFDMIGVTGGTFTMGATTEQGNNALLHEKPTHDVTLGNYAIGKYEVTQKLWWDVMGSWPGTPSPTYGSGDDYPIYNVSHGDIQGFLTALNAKTGKNYRLPTEAEWEYAARGGAQTQGYKFSGGEMIGDVAWYGGEMIGDAAWYGDNSDRKTHTVGTKSPNELGIYDMSGNVWEWCSDWYGSYSSGPQTNPQGATTGLARVVRGGGWASVAADCRVSHRYYTASDSRYFVIGFRLALSL